jgi:hypothetical protein
MEKDQSGQRAVLMGGEDRWWEQEGCNSQQPAKLVYTMAAMSEMRTEGNKRTLDVACSVVPNISHREHFWQLTTNLPVLNKSSFFTSRTLLFKNKSRMQFFFFLFFVILGFELKALHLPGRCSTT